MKYRFWISVVLKVFIAAMLIMSGFMKISHNPGMMAQLPHMGLPEEVVLPIGIVEWICLAVFLFTATSVLGAILLTGYAGGAILTHVRIHEGFFPPALLGILAWLAVYLVTPQIREVIPFIKKK